jgi:hypothetical protein
MATVHRVSMTAVVILCMLGNQWSATLFASEAGDSSSTAAVSPPLTTAEPDAQAPASLGLVNRVAIGWQSGETTDGSYASGLQSGRVRLPFEALALTEALGTVMPRGKSTFGVAPAEFARFAGQIYQGAPYPYRRRHDGSIAAIMIGAAAAITGAAVLVYANRPGCATSAVAGGCGYGTKVVGTSVLSGGIVGLFVGALTWR